MSSKTPLFPCDAAPSGRYQTPSGLTDLQRVAGRQGGARQQALVRIALSSAPSRRARGDAGRLRRFFLNWGLKESYVKAMGQGLGFDLRRISFSRGDWLDCCVEEGEGRGDCESQGDRRRPSRCAPCETVGEEAEAAKDGEVCEEGYPPKLGCARVEVRSWCTFRRA